MLAKLTALVQSKTALAVLGVVLVGGGSGAVAVAATTGHLNTLGVNLNSSETKTPEANGTEDAHANTVGVVGLLTGCTLSGNTGTMSVTDKSGKSWTFNVTATTKFNGDVASSGQGASSAKGDNSSSGGSSTDHNASGGSSSANEGGSSTEHSGPTASQVCALTNRDVQVQATPNGTSYDAWKVTVQGPRSAEGGDSSNNAGTGSSTDSKGSNTAEQKDYEGTVSAVTANGFTLTHNGASFQVVVTSTTKLSGATDLSAITAGSHVSVTGTVSGTTLTATYIEVSAPEATPSATGTPHD